MVNFGSILKSLRLQHDLTQEKLAQKLGLTKSVISAYETGIRMPSYDVLISIAKLFSVSTDYLLDIETPSTNIDVSGLSSAQIAAVKNLITSIRKR